MLPRPRKELIPGGSESTRSEISHSLGHAVGSRGGRDVRSLHCRMTQTQLTIADLVGSGERDLGTTDWLLIDQPRIDLFADATGDHQWIHVDPERARAGPFGKTIAHGYLSLSLTPLLLLDRL